MNSADRSTPQARTPTLADKVAFLSAPTAYPDRPERVDRIETHWSWLFLTPTRVFKLKKPLKRPFADLTTLARRQRNCADELQLNRRLAPQVYSRVVSLGLRPDGGLGLGGEGQVVDWLVEMHRLPAASMLDARLLAGRVSGDEATAIASQLAEFYANQRPQRRDGPLYIRHLLAEAAENRALLLRTDLGLATSRTRSILDRADALLQAGRAEIESRIASGYVVEGHGDLRPEHVCLTDPIQIFDCLEFDRSMRIIDPYDEVNYLGLECEFLGAGWLRPQLLASLDELIGHRPTPQLMAAYSSFRATLRARICLAHLLDDETPTSTDWTDVARAYLVLAEEEMCRA